MSISLHFIKTALLKTFVVISQYSNRSLLPKAHVILGYMMHCKFTTYGVERILTQERVTTRSRVKIRLSTLDKNDIFHFFNF